MKYLIFNVKFQKLGKNAKLHIFRILLEKHFIFLIKLILFQENLSKTLSIKKLTWAKLHFILPNVRFFLTIDILKINIFGNINKNKIKIVLNFAYKSYYSLKSHSI